MDMLPETEKSFRNILDCFTGSDGGAKFFYFRLRIEQLDKEAINGDENAKELINIMHTFSKLIDILAERS
jgi:hypothetical protein